MRNRINSVAAVFMVLALLMAGATGALAASFDTETTNTASTSEKVDGDTYFTEFNGSGDTGADQVELTIEVNSTDPGLEIKDPDTADNRTVASYDADDMTQTYAGTNTYYYNVTVNASDLSGMTINSGENKTATVRIINNATLDEANQTYADMTAYIEGVDGRTVLRMDQGAADSETLVNSRAMTLAGFSLDFLNPNSSSIDKDGVFVSDTTDDTITVQMGNDSAADNFDAAVNGLDDGAWTLSAPVQVNGNWHRTYVNSVPDDVNTTSDTFGVYDTNANELRIHVGDDYSSASTVDVDAMGNDVPGWLGIGAYGIDALTQSVSL